MNDFFIMTAARRKKDACASRSNIYLLVLHAFTIRAIRSDTWIEWFC